MSRSIVALALLTAAGAAQADTCSVAGTAYDPAGKPLRDAVVRLFNQETGQSSYSLTDANASYHLTIDTSGQTFRVDLLSHPTVVTGTHIATRSILGMSPSFACRGNERQDVRALVD